MFLVSRRNTLAKDFEGKKLTRHGRLNNEMYIFGLVLSLLLKSQSSAPKLAIYERQEPSSRNFLFWYAQKMTYLGVNE